MVTSIESKIIPIVEVGVSGGKDLFELKEVSKYVEKEIEKLPGVARVDRQGDRVYHFRVEISAKKLRSKQLSLLEVVKVLKEQNISITWRSLQSN